LEPALSLACCLAEQPAAGVKSSPGEDSAAADARSQFRRRLLASRDLHELVPSGAVWIRALADDQGRIRWWAWQTRGETLELLDSGAGPTGAVAELGVAGSRFDLQVERAWAACQGQFFEDMKWGNALEKLSNLAQRRLRDEGRAGDRSIDPRALASEVEPALASVGRHSPLLAGLGYRLLNLIAGEDPDAAPEAWMVEEFRAGWAALDEGRGPLPEDEPRRATEIAFRETQRREALDSASRRLLEVVQRHFDIRWLWSKLPREQWSGTDILFQVPGPLLAAPLAWLLFGTDAAGQPAPLFQTVASTGSVISLTLRHAAQDEATPPARRILGAHWEAPTGQRAARGMYRLQENLIASGRQADWEVWCLGDQPQATADNLCAALNDRDRRFGVVVVNAHGIQGRYGVKLAGSDWTGGGADLRDTDLIVLAACSVGRLQEDGSRDVEGLCAELAAHHGRTVVAARWPIADTETALLVSELVREYMETVQNNPNGPTAPLPPFARARALNRVRRRLLDGGDKRDVTFHLASAFEIYGLG